jgi:hypothetical protein
MINANILIFKMFDEESVSYIMHFENLEKIRRTKDPFLFEETDAIKPEKAASSMKRKEEGWIHLLY